MWYIYIVRCIDDSLYTGITTDLARRMRAHSSGKGAKYTLSHPLDSLCAAWSTESRSDALRLEYRIKQLTKQQKEQLVARTSELARFIPLDSALFTPLSDAALADVMK